LPGSKLSQMRTQWLNIGPGVALSRKFNLLSGLTLSYGARTTFHLNRYTTARVNDSTFQDCGGSAGANGLDPSACSPAPVACAPRDESCQFGMTSGTDTTIGKRNIFFDFGHGPAISFQPIETVSIDAVYLMTRGWLYPLAAVPAEYQNSE